ncbi:hypothetical protein [Marisediminitalea sp.]|uniref:hypothetical protein n=1 Tax=Marisediminitalea sp. TaxID=2662268 RepID=UPI003511C2AD|tara:strand:+ start:2802 stop:2963 length:162 start_codon:yes stop_codon:yes gene_type:complete
MMTSVFGSIDVRVVNYGSAKIEKGLQRTGTVRQAGVEYCLCWVGSRLDNALLI